ncbi:MAG: M20/M25/M40 family metallo-hydrolase [Chloroflexi bacterium]|nr:M20/M25/M40 family metallo-hydrolase [Chloroflexota bacterium]
MKKIFDYIDNHFSETVADLIRLCSQPGISAQGIGVEESARLVTAMLQESGIATQVLLPPGGNCPLVYGELAGDSPNTLLFYNHYDVQPPEPLELWTSPPFEPALYNGHLRARGAADNKGNIIARLAAIKALLAIKGSLPVTIKFCIEGDEEIGSPHLAAFVREHRPLLRADGCLWEGAGVNWQGQPTLVLGLKGILYVELEAQGASRDVHSSLATIVPNPAWQLVWALNTLKDPQDNILIEGFYDDVRPPTSAEVDAARSLPSEEAELQQSLGLNRFVNGLTGTALTLHHLFQPTVNICGLYAGYIGEGSKTVLPAVAKAKLDFRLVPQQRPEDILSKLRRHLDKHGFTDIALSQAVEGEEPARTPLDAPLVQMVKEAARQVYPMEPVIFPTMVASGPMACFTQTLGIPTVGIGVEYPDCRMHAPDENIRLADLALGVKHLAALMERLGRS